MLWTMMKNNLKLMLRSRLMIVLVILTPIVVIAALSSAFDGLLQSDYELDNIKIGYATQKDSMLDAFLAGNQTELEKESISLNQYSLEEGKRLVEKDEIDAFIYEEDENVKIYSLNAKSIPTEMCQYIIDLFYTECTNALNPQEIRVEKDQLESVKLSTAGNYYGIIETIYFLWCGMLFLTGVVQSERKNRISQRFMASPATSLQLYLSKFIPCIVLVCLNTVICAVAAAIIFDVNWGNLLATSGIIFVVTLAACAYGITCLYLVKNLAVSVILLFSTVWGLGFVGGSFETYMFSAIPESVKALSPLYFCNRTLVEFSTMGQSDYAGKCVLYHLVLFVIFTIIGSLLMKKRMEVE